MKKLAFIISAFIICGVLAAAYAATQLPQNKVSWRYKMTVTVETPEGEISGSAVRQMGNDLYGSPLSQQGNPADVRGEAVVIDLGERGVLFALISHKSDFEFYDTFTVPDGKGGATPEGIQYYASLSVGTKGVVNPGMPGGYPRLVTFTDMNDPLSVTLVQDWERVSGQPRGHQWTLKKNRFEELFGSGVKLKEITLEITDEPVIWGVVDQYLPEKLEELKRNWKELHYSEKERVNKLITFKQGEPQ